MIAILLVSIIIIIELLLLFVKLLLLQQYLKVPVTKALAHALDPKLSHFQIQLSSFQLLSQPSRLIKLLLLQLQQQKMLGTELLPQLLALLLRLVQLALEHLQLVQLVLAETKQGYVCACTHLLRERQGRNRCQVST